MDYTVLGYTGAYRDVVIDGYPLGNGYRVYLPWLMRFSAPDSWSPFGWGGINPYVYCANDPINCVDPSGHVLEEEAKLAIRAVDEVLEQQNDSALAARNALETSSSKPALRKRPPRKTVERFNERFREVNETKNTAERLQGYESIIEKYGTNKKIPAYDRANVHWNAATDEMSLVQDVYLQESPKQLTDDRPSLIDSIQYVEDAIDHMSKASELYTNPSDINAAQNYIQEYGEAKDKILSLSSRFTADIPEYEEQGPFAGSPGRERRMHDVGERSGRAYVAQDWRVARWEKKLWKVRSRLIVKR